MVQEVSVEDPDRRLEFHLRVRCRRRPAVPACPGWRDGGDPGEPAFVELLDVWCQGISVRCGSECIEADLVDERLQRRLGAWCAAELESEIVEQLLEEAERCR